MTLDELIDQGNALLQKTSTGYQTRSVRDAMNWECVALMFLQQHYPNHPQTKSFEKYVNKEAWGAGLIHKEIAILQAFRDIDPKQANTDYEATIDLIFNHFNSCARQLRRRYNGRDTLQINDEYDVQDLLHALFKLHFDDVRAEEWTPSYAGSCKRMDFLLKDAEIAVEVKMTRSGLKDKELGDQLIIDIAHYKEHPNCKMLYCFIFDPDGMIRSPRGLEKDLETAGNDFKVKAYIRPME